MKKSKLLLLGMLSLGLLATSCNKDQKAVKTLDGEWEATFVAYEGDIETDNLVPVGAKYDITFDACKLSKDEWCKLKINENLIGVLLFDDPEEDTTYTQIYKVKDDGKTLVVGDNESDTEDFKIETLEDDFLKLTGEDEDGKVILELKKK